MVVVVLTLQLQLHRKHQHQHQRQRQRMEGILVFSETAGFRHESISDGQTMLSSIANENGWEIDFTEDSSQFNATNLSQYSVVVWLNTTGDVLTNPRSA